MGISMGIVGLGAFGKGFAELFKKHPLVDRFALCDREPERVREFADREDFKDKVSEADCYDSLDALLESDLDAVAIITQPWLHAPQCIAAMEAGKHVYSAVPIISVPDGDEILDWCDRLIETCRKTGKHYMLGETTYYRPEAMFCRRKAAANAFGDFVYAEGEYIHPYNLPSCDLREVQRHREASTSGKEWVELKKTYTERGVVSGPMHYPTHSTSGPVCVMNAHATKVIAWPTYNRTDDPYFAGGQPANEIGLFHMSNGAVVRIIEAREMGHLGREIFRVYGTEGSFENDTWCDRESETELTIDQMRDALPEDVAKAWFDTSNETVAYGGHGGSHAYLVHEFVDAVANDRTPAINAWESARYMAMGVMAHKSALAGGELLDVPDWGDAPQ
jgi:predicted dehydrogenase